jgi:hypothetical protein
MSQCRCLYRPRDRWYRSLPCMSVQYIIEHTSEPSASLPNLFLILPTQIAEGIVLSFFFEMGKGSPYHTSLLHWKIFLGTPLRSTTEILELRILRIESQGGIESPLSLCRCFLWGVATPLFPFFFSVFLCKRFPSTLYINLAMWLYL